MFIWLNNPIKFKTTAVAFGDSQCISLEIGQRLLPHKNPIAMAAICVQSALATPSQGFSLLH